LTCEEKRAGLEVNRLPIQSTWDGMTSGIEFEQEAVEQVLEFL